MIPQIQYAMSGDISVAYQVTGDGPNDIVYAPGFISHLEHIWEEPKWARFSRELGSLGRLISFDKRGTGLSDRTVGFPSMDERIDDIRAVMDAAESEKAVLLGISEGCAMSLLFAATFPDRVSKLILIGGFINARESVSGLEDIEEVADQIRKLWGTGAMLSLYGPDYANDPDFLAWWAKFERLSASPSAIIGLRRNLVEIDVAHVLPSIHVPTLVIHSNGDIRNSIEAAREMAEQISDARLVEIQGEGHFVWRDETDQVMTAIREFVGTEDVMPVIDRVLSTMVFTDLVDSTQLAAEAGDSRWRSTIETHFSLARNELKRFRGTEVKTLGDGILATFDGPGRAVRCAQAIVKSMKPLGVKVRAGVHTGEIELLDDGDVRGIAVNTAARVSQQAKGDEVVVSRTVKDLIAGSGISLEELGAHSLKGLDEPVKLYRVSN